jgi:CheY-like chemotaxis protein
MHCLLVEDEPARVASIFPELQKYFGAQSIEVVGDRDAAMAVTERQAYDLVVLDQRIPTAAGQLDPDVIHGRAVLDHIRKVAPDTVVYFLTGLPLEDEYVDRLMAEGASCDIWGDRKPLALVRRFRKDTLAPFYKAVEEVAATARVTDDIEINTKGADIRLRDDEVRLLRAFARLQNGVCVDVGLLSPGVSGARVIKADIKDSQGGIRISAAGKLGKSTAIADEIGRYDREVVRLSVGAYAPIVANQVAQVLGSKAAFYRLLDGYDRSLFDVIKESDGNAAACVTALKTGQAPWFKNHVVKKLSVGEIAKELIWEDRLPAIHSLLEGIDWPSFEAREISINVCTRHGDLHGDNARIDVQHRALLIDYGAVGPLPSAIDAVTLELSPFFHPQGHRNLLMWTADKGEIDWFGRPGFQALTAVPTYIEATRAWAHDEAFGPREVLACAYIYLLRQLQFKGADQDLARAILAGIVRRGLA